MNAFTNMAGGMIAQRDENQRKRSELAQAFQQFRQTNPHATLAEMQQYIDAQSGGRNYLSRGAPSGQVLQSIADANAQAKVTAETNARLSQMQEQARVQSLIDEQANRALLDHNGDISAAQEAVRMGMGGDWGSIDPTGIFTPQRWQRIQREQIAGNYEMGKAIILDNMDENGKTKMTPQELAKITGLPPAVAEGISIRFGQEREREAQDRQAARDRELRQNRQAALAYVTTEIEKDPSRKPEEALGYFFDMDPSEIPPQFLESIRTDAQRNVDRANEERDRTLRRETAASQRELMGILAQDIDVQTAITNGDRDGAIRAMMAHVETFPEEIAESLTGQWLEQQIDGRIASLQRAQDLDIATRRDTLRTEAVAKGEELATRTRDTVDAAIESKLLTDPQVAAAASALAQTYAIAPEHIPLIEQVRSENPKAGPKEINDLVAATLEQAGVPRLADARSQVVEDHMRAGGGVEAALTFQDWEASVADQVNEDRQALDTVFTTAMNNPDPAVRVAELERAIQATSLAHEHFQRGVMQDEQNAIRILRVGTGQWDQARAARQVADHGRMVQAALTKLQAGLASARRQAEAQATRQVPEAAAAPRDGRQSVAGNALAGARESYQTSLELGRMEGQYARNPLQRLGAWITMPEDELAADDYMARFIKNGRGQLRANPDDLAAFQADPWAFLRDSNQTWVRGLVSELGELPSWYYDNP